MDHVTFAQLLGSYGEFVGAIGVVATLFYVGIQIRQNTLATKTASAQAALSVLHECHFTFATNGEAASIYRRCANDPAAVDPDERFRFNALMVAYYTQCDFAYRQYLRGQFDPDTWERMAYVVTLFASTPGGLEWWEQDKLRFSTQFIEFLDERTKTFEMPNVLPTVGAGDN